MLLQIGITSYIIEHYKIEGTFDLNYSVYLYVKPWCRIAPYAIGCLLAFYEFSNEHRKEPDSQEQTLYHYHTRSHGRWFIPHVLAVVSCGVTSAIVFSLYDNFRCKAEVETDCKSYLSLFFYGAVAPGNWSRFWINAYLTLGYSGWGIALAFLTYYAGKGYGGVVTKGLSHPVLAPFARLTYTAYLIHLICMHWFYGKSTAPIASNIVRQYLEAVGFIILAFALSFFLYLLVEKPLTGLLPYLFGIVKDERRSQLVRRTSMELPRELSQVTDIDSETIIISSPNRRVINDSEQPLLDNHVSGD